MKAVYKTVQDLMQELTGEAMQLCCAEQVVVVMLSLFDLPQPHTNGAEKETLGVDALPFDRWDETSWINPSWGLLAAMVHKLALPFEPCCKGVDALPFDRWDKTSWINPSWGLLAAMVHKLWDETSWINPSWGLLAAMVHKLWDEGTAGNDSAEGKTQNLYDSAEGKTQNLYDSAEGKTQNLYDSAEGKTQNL
ncbi:hypothetical protein CYMTET_52341 [Cymbomonas tetramitiformis]|uniref:Uncharacterized protein n=1 Tax=Cymbomonas tetramitiformis TaxID=36881 RepID=A0AAE0ESU8_9CHLO|nr:hypothetical protein CYMTET_52341 [Cymbomonas tetramitiformis]